MPTQQSKVLWLFDRHKLEGFEDDFCLLDVFKGT
jgi:hypothetical protein